MSELLAISKLYEHKFYDASAAVSLAESSASVEKIQAIADKESRGNPPYNLTVTDQGVSIVHISGVLTNQERHYNRYYGLISYQKIQESIKYVLEETETQVLILKYDTPGGSVSGMSDTAELISNITIPTISFAGGSMASAGYFLGSQSDEIYTDVMSLVGSIGVVMGWYNYTKMLSDIGIKPERFRSGDLKAAGDGDFNLTKKEREHISHLVNYMANIFFDVVSEARGVPLDVMKVLDITSGKEFVGEEAKQVMLVDDIMSFDEVLLKAYNMAEKALTNQSSQVYTGFNN